MSEYVTTVENCALYGPSLVFWSGFLIFFGLKGYFRNENILPADTARRLGLTSLLVLILTTIVSGIVPVRVVVIVLLLAVNSALVSLRNAQPESFENVRCENCSLSPRVYVIGLLLVMVFASAVRGIGLDKAGFIIDERIHLEAARQFLRSPEFPFWTFFQDANSQIYDRAWLYTVQVAGLFEVFGIGKGIGRAVSALWGMLLFVPVVWMSNLLGFTRLERLTVVWWIATSAFFVTISRWMRMYSMFLTVFLFWVIVLYQFIQSETKTERMVWGGLVVVVGSVSLHLHLLTVTILPGVFIYLMVERNPFNWLRHKSAVVAFIALLLLGTFAVPKGLQHLDFDQVVFFNHLYPIILSLDTLGVGLGTVVLVSVIGRRYDGGIRDFLILTVATTLLFFVFFTDRYMAYRYVSHLILLGIFPLVWGWYRIVNYTSRGVERSEYVRWGLVLVGLLLPLIKLRLWLPGLLSGDMGSLYTHVRLLGVFGLSP